MLYQTLYEILLAPFTEFVFMRRALIGTLAVSLGATPFGVFLMLRRMSLVGDAMAHAILPGVAIGYLLAGLSLTAMTLGGLVAGLIIAVLTSLVSRFTRLQEDASIAAFYLVSLALGVLIISKKGNSVDLMHVLFGSVLALDQDTLFLLAIIATLSILVMALLYRSFVLDCLDAAYARSMSKLGAWVSAIFLAMIVLNLVGGFHALGTLMAVGIMILPAVIARFWATSLAGMLFIAVIAAILCSWIGLLLSFHLDLPSGPTIILGLGILYVFSVLCGQNGGVFSHHSLRLS